MTGAPFIDTAEVAGLLRTKPEQFLRQRTELEDDHGFPLPMPHWKRPLKWRRDMVEGWIEAQGRPKDETAAALQIPAGGNVVRLMDYAKPRPRPRPGDGGE